ncbi:PLP-dependent aminotransferase family protein [Xylanimonas protaetiae]|uniref:PLP-dependent aminotransferase family protein n=1 Tax=Xylanimonas protaetiae TaxID=2509457 RepID=A0A4P6FAL9_9MICO|nr:PLP-dependent aminotransferase family protein [Xylanimonas protaetiae]QAY71329.1 PLP-dependent aminotransferase family protein [Xylanimonas protaetiae]
MTPPPVHRHLSPAAAVRLLGAWHAGGPAYAALADALRQSVLAGTLAPHTRLPSERELAVALGVSRATTTAAYRRLRDVGFAVARTGSGTVAVLPRPASPSAREAGGDAPAGPPAPGVDDVVDLSQATSAAPPELHDAFARALEALPAYLARGGYEPYGVAPLRAAIADRYTARGTPTSPDQILVTTGAQHAIALLAGTFVRPRDAAVVEDPTYVHALEALRRAGGRLVGVPSTAGGFDVDTFASALQRSRPRLAYLVPDFHNPTGGTLTVAERAAVRAAADRFGVTVVGDETLTDLVLDGPGGGPAAEHDAPPPFAGDGTSPHVVSVGSASKTFWGGLRIGWVRAHPDVVAQLAGARGAVDIASPLLDQLAVVELFARRDEVLAGRRATLRAQRDVLVDGLRAALPWDVPRPAGGLSLWPSLGAPLAQAFAGAAAAEGVLVNAGPTFSPHGSATDRVRLTFGRSVADLERALPRLVRAWGRVAA